MSRAGGNRVRRWWRQPQHHSEQQPDQRLPTSASTQSSTEYRKYLGKAGPTGGLTISFTASPSGISGLTGDTLLECIQTTGNSTTYGVNSTIPLSGNSFASDTTINLPSGDGTAELKVAGALDGSGHASGTLSYNIAGACDTGTKPIQWSASIGGSTTPTTAPSTSGCSPAPCGTKRRSHDLCGQDFTPRYQPDPETRQPSSR